MSVIQTLCKSNQTFIISLQNSIQAVYGPNTSNSVNFKYCLESSIIWEVPAFLWEVPGGSMQMGTIFIHQQIVMNTW